MRTSLKISRSGLKLFLECPRCFWLDVHHRIKRPPSYPYTLSSAVDFLVKQEFDKHRAAGDLPPVFANEGLDAKLYPGEELETWRNNFKGISYFDEDLNAMLYGAVDDVLEFADGSLAVVDYKSTGSREITIYDDYRKQMDVYTHILQRMSHAIRPHAYFVFYQVDKTGGGFSNVLPFTETLRRVDADPSWVAEAFEKAVRVARQTKPPTGGAKGRPCAHCLYVESAAQHLAPLMHDTAADKDYIVVEE